MPPTHTTSSSTRSTTTSSTTTTSSSSSLLFDYMYSAYPCIDEPTLQAYLKTLGDQGWDLVSISPVPTTGGLPNTIWILLKRSRMVY